MLQNIYGPLLAIHGIFRWVVVAAAVAAIVVAAAGWLGRKPWSATVRRCGAVFVGSMDLQLLLGLLLYFGASPVTREAFQNMAAAMKNHDLRFFAVEHTTAMLLAVICAHLGSVLSRKGLGDQVKYRRAAIWYSLSLLLVLAGIPWWRPFLRAVS